MAGAWYRSHNFGGKNLGKILLLLKYEFWITTFNTLNKEVKKISVMSKVTVLVIRHKT